MKFPEWLGGLSPFGHVPQIPVEDMSILSITMLILVAVILIITGFLVYNKRDIQG